ncbi:HDIG domain-containing protein [Kribbella turkmenica]|uniref:HDIG domain-containing protein n=1 Tax=Kribbella turkmenica TaxID=2530375 RepID=A0A4V2YHF3_9ACTN|nr:HDIG domain-containing metalloprotein [Kribbella turkmenica]TDD30817.1 HDIG domain-containing protein [Kribbella turkmenica]
MQLPTDREIRALHRDHAPTRAAFESVYVHCELVSRIAEQFLSGLDVDGDLVRAGCLLHDLGVYRLYGPSGELDTAGYIRHGVLGHELLHDLGFPEELARFCSRHTGVGLARDDVRRQALPIPVDDYVPGTPEEELVLYADKFHSKRTPPVFVSGDSYAAQVARWGADKATAFGRLRERYGEPDLESLSARAGHRVS